MSKAKLVKKLDAIFSKYIRWYYADDNGYVECYTCGVHKHVKEMHNGHFQSRRHYSTRWNINNCRPQCPRCNLFAQGEQYIFGQKLINEIGEDAVNDIIALSKTTSKFAAYEYQELIDKYKNKLNKLM
jgi:hypothetical protein